MSDFPITIFHNPACGTSRNTLAMIEAAGYAPTVVEYLKAGWTRSQLQNLLAAMGVTARDAMREKGTPAAELGLLDSNVGDDQILEAMVLHPVLVNRPIVVTPKGTRLAARPRGSWTYSTSSQRPSPRKMARSLLSRLSADADQFGGAADRLRTVSRLPGNGAARAQDRNATWA